MALSASHSAGDWDEFEVDVSSTIEAPQVQPFPIPKIKACRFCGEDLDLDPQDVYLHIYQTLLVCPDCNQGMVCQSDGLRFRCVICLKEVSFKKKADE